MLLEEEKGVYGLEGKDVWRWMCSALLGNTGMLRLTRWTDRTRIRGRGVYDS